MARYGRAMLQSLPEETTQLLIDLCTIATGPLASTAASESGGATTPVTKHGSTSSYLSYLALNRNPPATIVSAETAVPSSSSVRTVRQGTTSDHPHQRGSTSGASTPPVPAPTISTLAMTPHGRQATTSSEHPPQETQLQPKPVKLPSPRIYFAHFVDHMEQFVVFLETVAERRYGQQLTDDSGGTIMDHVSTQGRNRSPESPLPLEDQDEREDQAAIWNTLLELYLTLPQEKDQTKQEGTALQGREREREAWRRKAMTLLRSKSLPYDPTHALILCSTHGYTEGLVLLWEKLGMYEDILRFWIERSKAGDASASTKVVERLLKYGPELERDDSEPQPQLYALVLRFLTSTPELLAKHRDDLKGILEHVEQNGIMPPLGVVQLLSRNGVATLGLVKDWLMARIKQGRDEIEKVRYRVFDLGVCCVDVIDAGPKSHQVVQVRNGGEIEAGQGTGGYRTSEGFPRNTVCNMQSTVGLARHTFHVQPQLPPEVRFFKSFVHMMLTCSPPLRVLGVYRSMKQNAQSVHASIVLSERFGGTMKNSRINMMYFWLRWRREDLRQLRMRLVEAF